jgi:hypothetical protein
MWCLSWCVPSKASKASKPKGAIKKKQRKSPKPAEKPHKIEQLLQDPEKRKHLGPCCVSYDGSIRGTKKWGDYPPGSLYTDGTYFFECMGCRKILDQPPPGTCGTSDDFELDNADLARIDAMEAAYKESRS